MTAAQSKKNYDLSDVLIDEKALAKRIAELGAQITGDYEGEVFPDGPDYPRIDKHSLALVHEREAVIENGFGRGIRIVIPPRPVFQKTARRERVRVAGFYLRALRRAIGISV